jgi:hypothetical protein
LRIALLSRYRIPPRPSARAGDELLARDHLPGCCTSSSRICSGWSCRRWVAPSGVISPESKFTDQPSKCMTRLFHAPSGLPRVRIIDKSAPDQRPSIVPAPRSESRPRIAQNDRGGQR